MCLDHTFVKVEDVDHSVCGKCFIIIGTMNKELIEKYPKGYCPHSFKVCIKCGKAVGYGSHGKLTVIPDTCKKQIERMRKEK